MSGLPPVIVPKRELGNAEFRHENPCYCLIVSKRIPAWLLKAAKLFIFPLIAEPQSVILWLAVQGISI
jgi:hypothetical protein